LASPSWRSVPQHGPLGTAAVAVVVEEEASMVVVLAVAAVSMAVGFVVAVLGAESAAAAVESALAERASQVAFGTLLARDCASLHLGVHHIDNLSILDDLADP